MIWHPAKIIDNGNGYVTLEEAYLEPENENDIDVCRELFVKTGSNVATFTMNFKAHACINVILTPIERKK